MKKDCYLYDASFAPDQSLKTCLYYTREINLIVPCN